MKTLLKLEEFVQVAIIIAYFYLHDIAWYNYLFLLLAPDISMVGYVFGNKYGAWAYNVAHHKGLALLIALSGFALHMPWMLNTGLILFGHSSLDRLFGYGLKFEEGFAFTHLGKIGKKMT